MKSDVVTKVASRKLSSDQLFALITLFAAEFISFASLSVMAPFFPSQVSKLLLIIYLQYGFNYQNH
jgi:hypothetical protein